MNSVRNSYERGQNRDMPLAELAILKFAIGNDLETTNTNLSVRLSKERGKGKEKEKIEEG